MPVRRETYTQAEIDRIRRLTETHGPTVAASIVGTCTETIANMRRRGWRPGKRGLCARPVPSDFAIQAGAMTIHELVVHYRSSIDTVRRWAKTVDRKDQRTGRVALAIPAQLATELRQLGTVGVARKHGVHPDTVRKWRKALGLDRAGRLTTPNRGWAERSGARRS